MASTTSNRSYRFPQDSDDYVPHTDIENLAEDVDADVQALVDAVQGRPRFLGPVSPTVTNNSVTNLTPDSATLNVGSMWSSGTSITVPDAGEYELGVVLRYASQGTASGIRQARVNVNGSEFMQWNVPAASNLNATNITVAGIIRAVLAASDVVSFSAFQNSGGSLAVIGSSRVWVEKVVQS